MMERLTQLVLSPNVWLGGASDVAPRQARYHLEQVLPLSQFQIADFTERLDTRLVLLHQAEWELLGLSVALLPYTHQIEQSMDGRLRRAVTARFSEDQVKLLDSIALPEPGTAFLLPRKSWEAPDQVALAGIQAIAQICDWTPGQRAFMALRFSPTSPAVSNLTLLLVEELCKISLPNLPWLCEKQLSTAPVGTN